jgi:hypothetical protein
LFCFLSSAKYITVVLTNVSGSGISSRKLQLAEELFFRSEKFLKAATPAVGKRVPAQYLLVGSNYPEFNIEVSSQNWLLESLQCALDTSEHRVRGLQDLHATEKHSSN